MSIIYTLDIILLIFIVLVTLIIPRFFPAIQYKIEEFRNRKKDNDNE